MCREKTLTYRIPRIGLLAWLAALASAGMPAAIGIYGIYLARSAGLDTPIDVWVGIVVRICFVLLFLLLGIVHILERRNASVLIHCDGITATNWKGRSEHLGWQNIRYLIKRDLGGLFRFPLVTVVGDETCIGLGQFLQDRDWLVNEIVERSSLNNVSSTWYHIRYTRVD